MPDQTIFFPPRRRGLLIHSGLALALAAGSGLSFWAATRQAVGTPFVLLLLLSLLLLPPLVLVIYRGYALMRARYELERDGLRLRWGLRGEDIPLTSVEWVRPANEMGFHLPMPFLPMPGAILGSRKVEGLGVVEYMAGDADTLLLVATPERVFAISPADPKKFLRIFQRTFEMGSLSPLESFSSLPAAFLQRVWADRPARVLILAALLLTIALFVVVGMSIPGRGSVSLGFTAAGAPQDPVPAEQLLLLPVLCSLIFAGDLVVGLYFFHRESERAAAYLVWAGAVLTPVLLLIASVFIL